MKREGRRRLPRERGCAPCAFTSLAEAGSGTLAGNAQRDVWRQIVSRDAAIIGAALDRTLVQPYLRARFPDRPAAASFALGADRDLSAEEVFEVAAKARTAGYVVAEADLEGRTGFALEREQDAPGMGAAGTGGLFNARVPDGMPLQSPAIPLQNARTGEGATTGRPGEKPPSAGLLEPSAPGEGETRLARAMQRDLRPAARIIAEALRTHDWKAARKQLAGALKECGTESAEALEAEMREAGEKAWPETHAEAQRGGGAEGVANSGTSEGARKGWDTRRRNGWTPKQYEENKAKVDSLVDDLGKTGPGEKGKGWKNREESFGGLDAGTIADIKKANPRMDVDGSEAIVDTAQLHHAMKEHGPGKEKHPGQIPITHEDLKRIPDVLSDYDSISPGKGPAEGKREEAVVFRKAYPDGTIACVELDQYSEKRKKRVLKFQTMWKEKA